MAAVPEIGVSEPVADVVTARSIAAVPHRRLVAVAVTTMELLRPESDLAHRFEGAGQIDLLLACDDGPADAGPVGKPYPDYPDDGDPDGDPDSALDAGAPDGAADLRAEVGQEAQSAADRLHIADLHLHRLGLRAPLALTAEGDLVAALSELIGFDPEPGVVCLAPAQLPVDPSRAVVDRAVQRIARVYGIPILRYRCLELSVVGDKH